MERKEKSDPSPPCTTSDIAGETAEKKNFVEKDASEFSRIVRVEESGSTPEGSKGKLQVACT